MALLFSVGCAAYRMGHAGDPPVSSLFITPVKNQSDAPQVVVPFTNALREELLLQSDIRPAMDELSAGGTLEVVIHDYGRSVAATNSSDTVLGESFRTSLRARATLRKADGSVLFEDREFSVESIALIREDLVQAEFQNIPVLSRNLAEKMVRAILNSW